MAKYIGSNMHISTLQSIVRVPYTPYALQRGLQGAYANTTR